MFNFITKENIGNRVKVTFLGVFKFYYKNKNYVPNKGFVLPKPFKNEAYLNLKENYDNFFDHYNDSETSDNRKKIRRISFELSNICNYSFMHKKCPTSCYKEKVVLPSNVFFKTIDEVASWEWKFDGVIAFHKYNEPLIDPRLFNFIAYVNQKLSHAKVFILTNGFYLTQGILNEFEKYNIWCIAVSSYILKEHERLIQLKTTIPYHVFFSVLDERKSLYEAKEKTCRRPCFAPLNDLTINCYGDVNLCCLDWMNKYSYGNLAEKMLCEIVNSKDFQKIYESLKVGNRNCCDLCKRCDWSR